MMEIVDDGLEYINRSVEGAGVLSLEEARAQGWNFVQDELVTAAEETPLVDIDINGEEEENSLPAIAHLEHFAIQVDENGTPLPSTVCSFI